jgi:hypothetical protein
MEMAMLKTTITGALAVLAAAVLVSGPAAAGGGATSAASKYSHTSQVAAAQTSGPASRDFRITEYSSSSARPHAAKHH